VPAEDILHWAIEFSAKEKGKSVQEESKYFSERFNEFVHSHEQLSPVVDEAATEYENAREQYKYDPFKLIFWIADKSRYNKPSIIIKFMKWLKTPPPNTTLPPADVH